MALIASGNVCSHFNFVGTCNVHSTLICSGDSLSLQMIGLAVLVMILNTVNTQQAQTLSADLEAPVHLANY